MMGRGGNQSDWLGHQRRVAAHHRTIVITSSCDESFKPAVSTADTFSVSRFYRLVIKTQAGYVAFFNWCKYFSMLILMWHLVSVTYLMPLCLFLAPLCCSFILFRHFFFLVLSFLTSFGSPSLASFQYFALLHT